MLKPNLFQLFGFTICHSLLIFLLTLGEKIRFKFMKSSQTPEQSNVQEKKTKLIKLN